MTEKNEIISAKAYAVRILTRIDFDNMTKIDRINWLTSAIEVYAEKYYFEMQKKSLSLLKPKENE